MTSSPQYALVALDVAVLGPLSYSIPPSLRTVVRPGQLVEVPFRNRSKIGLVMSVGDDVDPEIAPKVRDIVDVVDVDPLLTESALDFLRFIADYYMSPLGDVARLAIPSAVRLDGAKHYTATPNFDVGQVPPALMMTYASLAADPVAVSALRA